MSTNGHSHTDNSANEGSELSPEYCPGLYRRAHRWHYLLTIRAQHLQSQKVSVPLAIAQMLQLDESTPLELPSAAGRVTIKRNGNRVEIGPLNAALGSMEVEPRERVWLDFHDGQHLSVYPAPDRVDFGTESGSATASSDSTLSARDNYSLQIVGLANYLGISSDEISESIATLGGEDGHNIDAVCESLIAAYLGLELIAPRRKILQRFRYREDSTAIELAERLWLH